MRDFKKFSFAPIIRYSWVTYGINVYEKNHLTSIFKWLQHENKAKNLLENICQAIKFGQLIEYNKRNIFLQKSCGIMQED